MVANQLSENIDVSRSMEWFIQRKKLVQDHSITVAVNFLIISSTGEHLWGKVHQTPLPRHIVDRIFYWNVVLVLVGSYGGKFSTETKIKELNNGLSILDFEANVLWF